MIQNWIKKSAGGSRGATAGGLSADGGWWDSNSDILAASRAVDSVCLGIFFPGCAVPFIHCDDAFAIRTQYFYMANELSLFAFAWEDIDNIEHLFLLSRRAWELLLRIPLWRLLIIAKSQGIVKAAKQGYNPNRFKLKDLGFKFGGRAMYLNL